ncbi:MAG: rhomboid family intramembrane serine protease [Pseudorhodoplanes sp.]
MTPSRQPILNIPPVMTATLAVLIGVHLVRVFLLAPRTDLYLLLLFAFIPGRYNTTLMINGPFPGGVAADIWTFVSYALLHADLMHLGFNAIWMLAFGTPVARRFGPVRFLLFLAATAAAGALAHLVTHLGQMVPMIGASAAISGAMAASLRFAFQRGGPLFNRHGGDEVYRQPALPLLVALRHSRILAFVAVWFGINLLLGLGSISLTGEEQSVAWQAHAGGFLAGIVLFGWFDPVRPAAV